MLELAFAILAVFALIGLFFIIWMVKTLHDHWHDVEYGYPPRPDGYATIEGIHSQQYYYDPSYMALAVYDQDEEVG